MGRSSPKPSALNAQRDALVEALRQLVRRFGEDYPAEWELRGILDRAEGLIDTYAERIEELAVLDLEAPADPADGERILEVFGRLQHLPRMILAMGSVLAEEEEDAERSLAAVEEEAKDVASQLEALIHLWVLRQGFARFFGVGGGDEDEDEDEDEG